MKTYKYTIFDSEYEVYLYFSKYTNQRTAIELIDAEDGIPFARATVNVPDIPLEDGEICVKDYSENEGMLDFLIENKIVESEYRFVRDKFLVVPICKLLVNGKET